MKKYKILKIKDEYKLSIKTLSFKLIRNEVPISLKNDYNWNQIHRDGLRHQNRVEELLYRTNTLKNQALNNIAREINSVNELHLTYSRSKFKKYCQNEIINEYSETINCNNDNCRDCQ